MPLAAAIKIPMGTLMPSFQLSDPDRKEYRSSRLAGPKGLLVIFVSDHCPYTDAAWPRLVRHANYAKDLKIRTVAINVHRAQGDGIKGMKKKIKELTITFPYLFDKTQKVAQNFQAQCTPEIFLYDQDLKLAYHGRIDDNWEDEAKVAVPNLKNALDAVAAGKPAERRQISSMGSSIGRQRA